MDDDTSHAAGFLGRNVHAIAFPIENPETGQFRWKGVVGSFVITLNNSILMATMIFCGFKIYSRIKQLPNHKSCIAIETHKALYNIMMLQTLAPLFLLHIPAAATFVIPVFTKFKGFACHISRTYRSRDTDLIMLPVMFYPITEPLIVIYFLLKKQIKKKLCIHPSTPVASVSIRA